MAGKEGGREGAGGGRRRRTVRLQDRYSGLDRFLHRFAFGAIRLQKALSDVEDRLYAGRLSAVEIQRPVFVTALPRAGTTLLLEILASLRLFAAHTYRNMPFVLLPLLWRALSSRFHVPGVVAERAHGDGVAIGFDSPEAFEEVVWRAFWPEKYLDDRLVTWTAADRDAAGDFEAFFRSHVAKMIALQAFREPADPTPGTVRYLSKNNANISRIPKVVRLFPDAVVLVPFRNPLDQAASLLRQHLRFRQVHEAEPFTRRYMADLGHLEFGANLRPVDFDGWLRREDLDRTHTADFWLRYWCAAYGHVLANAGGRVVLVDYDSLCVDPARVLRGVGAATGITGAAGSELEAAAHRLRAPTRYPAAPAVHPSVLDAASSLHRELRTRSSAG